MQCKARYLFALKAKQRTILIPCDRQQKSTAVIHLRAEVSSLEGFNQQSCRQSERLAKKSQQQLKGGPSKEGSNSARLTDARASDMGAPTPEREVEAQVKRTR